MLSADEVVRRLCKEPDDSDRLAIVPSPNLEQLLRRGATSIDLRLGRWFRSFKQSQSKHFQLWRDDPDPDHPGEPHSLSTKEHFVPFGNHFVLHPGRFVLGATLEWLSLPPNLSGYVTGKSSLGRHGLVIETAAGLHPKFSGCLTLELANVGEVPLTISPGMEICQIFLHATDGCKDQPNPGNFSGQRKPSIALPSPDSVFKLLRRPRAAK
jgi:dCTP deaminase